MQRKWLLLGSFFILLGSCFDFEGYSPSEQDAGVAGTDGAATGGSGGAGTGGTGGVSGSGGSAGQECTLATDSPACNICFRDKCESECVTASQETTLMAYMDCFVNCNDPTCRNACNSQYPAGKAAYDSFAACLNARCLSECSDIGG
jgi:hypothetical protein